MMGDLVAAGLDQLHERISGRFARAAVSMFRVPVTFTGKNGSTAGEAPIRPAA